MGTVVAAKRQQTITGKMGSVVRLRGRDRPLFLKSKKEEVGKRAQHSRSQVGLAIKHAKRRGSDYVK